MWQTWTRAGGETFVVNLTSVTGAVIGDGQGVGTIVDNGDVCTHVGTAGDDFINGTAGNDHLCGLGGNDVLLGQAGDDVIESGTGDDRIQGMAGNDSLRGGRGTDLLSYETPPPGGLGVIVDMRIIGSAQATRMGSDTLLDAFEDLAGSDNADVLRGNSLANRIVANNGDDTVFGFDGPDVLFGSEGADVLHGGPGNDFFNGGRLPGGALDTCLQEGGGIGFGGFGEMHFCERRAK